MSAPAPVFRSVLPTGTVTFLLTDIEGYSGLCERSPNAMRLILARHDLLAEEIVTQHGGAVLKHLGEGDSLFIVFARATDAVAAACALQIAYHTEPWPEGIALRVRMALHTGEAELRNNDYFGPVVNRCARMRAITHGEQTLLSQATSGLVRDALPTGAGLRDLGLHRLRDLQQPEQVFQLLHPTLPADFPPLKSLGAFAHNLPVQLTSFIGREQEIAEIKRLAPTTHLLTLKGAGGCGKTRLALQVAADLLDDYLDGVWFVELAPLSDPERVPQAVATVLRVRETSDAPLTETLVDTLKSKTLLLVLDNCEHLVRACALFADSLLRACPNLRILATSREPLTIAGETVWDVPPLASPDANNLPSLEDLVKIEAARLFIERARATRPKFVLSPKNAPALAKICQRMDGLPLAIELAAARVDMFTVEEIDEHLFSLLDEPPITAPERHHSLHDLMDWSYNLLQPQEQTLLRRLSVFAGGWTRRAALEVCTDAHITSGQIIKLLSRLVRASLVIAEEQEEGTRYRMLETVREYVAEKLRASEEETAVQDRHVHYFLELAEETEPHLLSAEQALCLMRLEAEHDNLRHALKLAVDSETRLRLAGALWLFWYRHSYLSEGRAWLGGALSRTVDAPEQVRAKALHGAGAIATLQGDYEAASTFLEQSLELWRQLQDPRGIANVSNLLGMLASNQGNYVHARAYYEESLAISRQLGKTDGIAGILSNLAAITTEQNDYTSARPLLEESLELYRQLGDDWGIATALHNLGNVMTHQQDHTAAAALYQESLAIEWGLGDTSSIAASLDCLANCARHQGDYKRAARLFGAAEAARELLGIPLASAELEIYAKDTALVRSHLSEVEFSDVWAAGRTLSLEQAIRYALRQDNT